MGRDKALIEFRGRSLWQHQLDTLRQTFPQELLISAPAEAPYGDAGVTIVPDQQADQGPLGGVAAVLRVIETEWLLLLPVDLPKMTPALLSGLLSEVARSGRGVVAIHEDGKLEPLVAVYPKAALAPAEGLLQSGERRLSVFVEGLERAGLISKLKLPADVAPQFANWNSPTDVTPSA